jgi:hypothetical protein
MARKNPVFSLNGEFLGAKPMIFGFTFQIGPFAFGPQKRILRPFSAS